MSVLPAQPLPTTLFFNHFPPSGGVGGSVLIRRLLAGFPREKIIGLTAVPAKPLPPEPPWCAEHVQFRFLNEDFAWPVWRFRGLINRGIGLLNWALLVAPALQGARLVRKHSASAILSVAAGSFFLPAAALAKRKHIPFVLIVHDDWLPIVSQAVWLPRSLLRRLYRYALRSADHVIAVSVGMQELLKRAYGVESEVQMPATEPWDLPPTGPLPNGRPLRILYAGAGWASHDAIALLVRVFRQKRLREYGIDSVELHLCTPWSVDADPDIKQHGWVTEKETREWIAACDILLLPYSFLPEEQDYTRTSFPAKTADYLASGKAIFVLGPRDSTICRYALEGGWAEVVTEPSEDAVTRSIARLARDEEYRRTLSANALHAFAANHDIRKQRERLMEILCRLAGGAPLS